MQLYGKVAFDSLAWALFDEHAPAHVTRRTVAPSPGVVLLDLWGRTASVPASASLSPLIALAALTGAVVGQLTEDLVEGCHVRRVTRFAGGSVLLGEGRCLRSPVRAYAQRLEVFEDRPRLRRRPGATVDVLVGAPTALWCACGGRDTTGWPSCASVGEPAAPMPAARR